MLLTVRVETENHVKRRQYQMYDLLFFGQMQLVGVAATLMSVGDRFVLVGYYLLHCIILQHQDCNFLSKKRAKIEQFGTLDGVL